jgi:hypothetical protein
MLVPGLVRTGLAYAYSEAKNTAGGYNLIFTKNIIL